jgi:hypothetical protein
MKIPHRFRNSQRPASLGWPILGGLAIASAIQGAIAAPNQAIPPASIQISPVQISPPLLPGSASLPSLKPSPLELPTLSAQGSITLPGNPRDALKATPAQTLIEQLRTADANRRSQILQALEQQGAAALPAHGLNGGGWVVHNARHCAAFLSISLMNPSFPSMYPSIFVGYSLANLCFNSL